MRIVYIILSVLFVLFGVVQINDVDPFFWVTYYLLIAALYGSAAFGKYNIWAVSVALVITLINLFRLLPEFQVWMQNGMPSIVESMKAETPYVEFVREFLGLAISLLAVLFLLIQRNRIPKLA